MKSTTPQRKLRPKTSAALSRAVQTIDAVLADPEVARALDFPIGSPLLRIERTFFTSKNQPVQFTRSWYRSDRHKYTVTLSDWGASRGKKSATARASTRANATAGIAGDSGARRAPG